MKSPEGAFYSAEDADSEGEEGKFYVWKRDEIFEHLTDEQASSFVTCITSARTETFVMKPPVNLRAKTSPISPNIWQK